MANAKGRPQPKGGSSASRKNKQKQPTQRTPQQRVMIIGPTGKKRLEWRDWA